MTIEVLMFGPARDLAGTDTWVVEMPDGSSLADLIEQVCRHFPKLSPGFEPRGDTERPAYRCAVNESFCAPDRALAEGDQVAVIPPVSGGADEGGDLDPVELVRGPIEAGWVGRRVGGCPEAGGVVTFEGTTRADRHAEHGSLVELFYEAYPDMARTQMRRLLDEARRRWPIERAGMVHRLGQVPIGETSVSIAVACAHRSDAFEACRWLIDSLKQEVPIWKKEVWSDGQHTWVDPTGHEPGPPDLEMAPG